MFQALTLTSIDFLTVDGPCLIEANSLISVIISNDGTTIGHFGTMSFTIDSDEYVKLTSKVSNLTH